jgi:hypothetical protein
VAEPTISLRSSFSNVLSLPLLLLVFILRIIFNFVFQIVGTDPLEVLRDFFRINQEADQTIRVIPGEQREQRRQLNHVQSSQIHQRERLEQLRRRVQRLEERRASREAHDQVPNLSPSNGRNKWE